MTIMDNISVSNGNSIRSNHNSTFVFNENLNVEFLAETYGSNLSFGAKMFGIFLKTIQRDLAILEASANSLDFEGMIGIAHKIKNNFTWVGLPVLSQLTYRVENMAREEEASVVSVIQELMKKSKETYPYVEQQFYDLNALV